MPPKPSSVDGITRQAIPAPPHPVAATQSRPPLPQSAAQVNQKPAKSQVKASRVDYGPTIVITLTIIFMVLLIGLAYFAYTKSK